MLRRDLQLSGLGAAPPSGGAAQAVSLSAARGLAETAQMYVHWLATSNRPRAQRQLRVFQEQYNRNRASLEALGDPEFIAGLPPALAVDGLWGPNSRAAVQRALFIVTSLTAGMDAARPWAQRMPGLNASGAHYGTWLAARPSGSTSVPSEPDGSGFDPNEAVHEFDPQVVLGRRATAGAQWPWYIGLAAVLGFGGWLAYQKVRS